MQSYKQIIKSLIIGILVVAPLSGFCQKEKQNATGGTKGQYGFESNSNYLSRITVTPPEILEQFRDAGMSPTEHRLTKEEKEVIAAAFAALPPFHRWVLREHLKSISFLDNMPNTALTSPIAENGTFKLYHITFRAVTLHQNISEWLTEKERTCYQKGDSAYSVSLHGGTLNALTYVLLHEGTHVVDGSIHIIGSDTIAGKIRYNAFTKAFKEHKWNDITSIICPLPDSLVIKNRFRKGGALFRTSEAVQVYQGLQQIPFVSLYSTSSWHEDLAEFLAVYHLTQVLKQPFKIIVTRNGRDILTYEPMKSPLLSKEFGLMRRFYEVSDIKQPG